MNNMNVWQNRLDNKYDVFVEPKDDGYKGDLVVKEGEKELLREQGYCVFWCSIWS